MPSSTIDTLDWALRVCQSIAFAIHGVLGVTEPFTGCLREAFRDNGAMPNWFWPLAGLLLWTVAVANFSDHGAVVLAAQAYIAAFHTGGIFYHLRLGHHPVAGIAPGVFALLAAVIVAIRTRSLFVAIAGWAVCAAVAYVLSLILVTPPAGNGDDDNEDNDGHSSLLQGESTTTNTTTNTHGASS
eukprot:CAMPEP_0172389774 /NCGR_PEP_ID=MMETSP1061-20121228/6583_1 /TAXON_ID=37318 /ORGANISM="Pseudo-nitzschia pungens, Strain cf. pungens" /LENGTH=184 /DNA_ID=CAMNT_0013119995 /DNA_START=102 /DNA_END=656 /DNA_ORIENTATION=-